MVGAIGAAVPLLPSFPFLLLAAVCFAKSSERLHNWFLNTQLYKKNLETYVSGKGMTRPAKRRVILMVTLVMGFGFVVMLLKKIYIPCFILALVWLGHVVYFLFGVATVADDGEGSEEHTHVKK